MAERQHRGDGRRAGRSRHDLRHERRPARDRRADDDGVRRPDASSPTRAAVAVAAQQAPRRRRRTTLYPQLLNRKTAFVYVQRFADPTKAAKFLEKSFTGVELLSRGEARLPAGHGRRRRSSASPAPTTRGSAGSRSPTTSSSAGKPGQADDRPRSVRAGDRRRQRDAERQGQRRLHDDRPHDPGERRSRCCARPSPDGTRRSATRDRARPAHRRRARDGAGAGLRRERLVPRARRRCQRNRAVTDMFEPGSTFKLVTVAGALTEGLVTPGDDVQAAVLDPGRRPRASTTPSCAAPRRLTVAQILSHSSNVGAITIAEKLGAPRPR